MSSLVSTLVLMKPFWTDNRDTYIQHFSILNRMMSMCHMQPGWLKMTNLIRHKKVSLNCMGLSVVCASFPRGQHCRGLTLPILLWEADNGQAEYMYLWILLVGVWFGQLKRLLNILSMQLPSGWGSVLLIMVLLLQLWRRRTGRLRQCTSWNNWQRMLSDKTG